MSENYDGPQMAQKIMRLQSQNVLLNKEVEDTRQNNWDLCTAVREYHEAITAMHTFINAYLQGGGDSTNIPQRWHDLDAERQAKYAKLVQLAGLVSC